MLNIVSSSAAEGNPDLTEVTREKGENNLGWLERHWGEDGNVRLLLLGGRDQYAFRLRIAQSHVRHNMTPSNWSHVGILGPRAENFADTTVYEISLQPPRGFGFPAATNAVQETTLGNYRSRRRFPNIALLRVAVEAEQVIEAIGRFKMQRNVTDAKELVLHWLAFVWGAGRAGNPLLNDQGIPSAVMAEVTIGAAGYDVTPGLESRASCPEAIWQAARWWSQYYTDQGRDPITGAWHAEHFIGREMVS